MNEREPRRFYFPRDSRALYRRSRGAQGYPQVLFEQGAECRVLPLQLSWKACPGVGIWRGSDPFQHVPLSRSGHLCNYSWSRDRHRPRIHPRRSGSRADRRAIFLAPGDRDTPGAPSGLRKYAFFLCWTRKEAYIKARGEGLSLPLGPVRRVACSRGTRSAASHPARSGRSAPLVFAGVEHWPRLCICSCGGRTRLVSRIVGMARITFEIA